MKPKSPGRSSPDYAKIVFQVVLSLMISPPNLIDCLNISQNQIDTEQSFNSVVDLYPKSMLTEIRVLKDKCSDAERNLDKCSAQLIGYGDDGMNYPENMHDLNNVYCPKVRELVSCIKNNTDCYKPFERQIIK